MESTPTINTGIDGAAAAAAPAAPAESAPASTGHVMNTGAVQPPSPAAAAPVASAVVIPDNWKMALGEEFKDDPTISKYASVPDLAKAHVSLQKLVGKDKISLPDKHATPEDWKGVFQKLGLPSKPEDYQFEVPKDAFNPEFVKDFKDVALNNNILPKQAEGLLKWYADLQSKTTQQQDINAANERHQTSDALRKEWGEAYQQKIVAGETAARRFFNEQGLAFLDNSGLSSNIHIVKAFSAIGDLLKEHGIKGNPATHTGLTPEDAVQRKDAILNDKNHPYWKKDHANHKQAVDEVQRLFRAAHPEG